MISSSHDDERHQSFLVTFLHAKGTIPAVIISTLFALSIGCTVGVVPEILADRYARLYHGYSGESMCADLPNSTSDDAAMGACQLGGEDAQAGSAWASFFMNLLTLFCGPVVGSRSDIYGRRSGVVISMLLSSLPPVVFVLLQFYPVISPTWYFVSSSLVGLVSYLGLIFAALSDGINETYRAPSFALIMAGMYSGFSFAPSLALVMTRLHVSVLSAAVMGLAFLLSIFCFPETLPEEVMDHNRQRATENIVDEEEYTSSTLYQVMKTDIGELICRPFREMAILQQNRTLRFVALGSFFSAMVFSVDQNLMVFYVEDHLGVRENDIAKMFLVMGMFGILFQACLLQSMIKCFGEKGMLVITFCSGTLHNFLYGAARNKVTIYVALSFSQLTKTNYPILSSFASQGVSDDEHGKVQSALFALNAAAAACGPLLLQQVYDITKKSALGAGTMFFCASFLYFVGTICVACIPATMGTTGREDMDEMNSHNQEGIATGSGITEPLLSAESLTEHADAVEDGIEGD